MITAFHDIPSFCLRLAETAKIGYDSREDVFPRISVFGAVVRADEDDRGGLS